jgi:hypothetical protein
MKILIRLIADYNEADSITVAGLIVRIKIIFDVYCQSIYLKQNFAV